MKKNVILFGASNFGNTAYLFLKDKYNIIYYCDNDINKVGKTLNDIEIIDEHKLKELDQDYDIIITSSYFREIAMQLKKMNINEYFIFDIVNATNTYILKQLKSIEKDIYEIIYHNDKIKFYLPDLNDYIQRTIYDSCTFFELEILERISMLNLDGKVIIDVGANIGNHSLFFATNIKNSKVYSFEPNKNITEVLNKNISINGIKDRVNISNVGLGNREARGNIKIINPDNIGGSKVILSESGEFEIKTLDGLFKKFNEDIGFIKIDVEGMEIDVLEGGSKLIERFKPIICVEAHGEEQYLNINKFLKKYGYKKIYYDDLETYIFSVEG